MRLQALALVAALALTARDTRAQVNPAPAPPLPPVPGGAVLPLLDVDGHELKPGELPVSTTAIARERWQKVLVASLPPPDKTTPNAPPRAPVTAFDLQIDVRYRASDASTNDMPHARYQWLAPNFMRADTGRGRATVRGPDGSYLIDASDPDHVERVKIGNGREDTQSRRELDEQVGIAGNFARLTDPQSVRIRKLSELAAAPAVLPEALREKSKNLAWIELESPDFFIMRGSGSVARVSMGVNVIKNVVELVVVNDASLPAPISASTAVLSLDKYKSVDGFQVPHAILVWLPEIPDPLDASGKTRLRETPAMDMVVKAATLRATLKPADFRPDVPLR